MIDSSMVDLFGEEVMAAKKGVRISQREQDELREAVLALLNSKEGKLFLWWVLNQTHVFQTSFTGNSMTYFLEGERNIGLKIYNQVMAANPRGLQELIEFRRSRDAEE